MDPTKKITENIIGKHDDGVVEKTVEKTVEGKGQATTSKEIVDNIL